MKFTLVTVILSLLISPSLAQKKTVPTWPEITQLNKPWSRWWWEGSAVNQKDLTWMMKEYKEVGLGGLEITPIYGVKGYESQFINYLTPKWMEMLTHTLKEGSRLGLGIDMAQASGWPFGGPWVSNEDASKYVAYKNYSLKSGETLIEKIEYIQEPLLRQEGERIDISKLVEPVASNSNLQLYAIDQVRFQKPLPLQALMAYSDGGEVLNLTDKVDKVGKLNWKAPKGNWTLYAVFEGWHGKMVERAGPGGEGYAIDHFSQEATKHYLEHFDKAFKGYDIKPIRAFFNDSYEVDDAQGEANWTSRFFEEFEKRRGYDLRNNLPALFGNDEKEKNERVLCDYRETISDLLLENYTQTWHEWAKGKGALIRNQAHGSPANILDLYAATDIPEIEGTDLLRIKFASSAANVTGKLLTSSESATWENEHFLSKLGDVKKAMDRFFLGGVNHTFYHGTNYTPQNEAWPGWLFYAAVHFTPTNPFWMDFKKLNSYVAHVQSFMQKGKPGNDILLYLPIYDSYSTPGRSLLQHYDGIEKGFKDTGFEENAKDLHEKGYSFDFISDRQLLNTSYANKAIQTGGNDYRIIVVPETKFMPLATIDKLIELSEKGATVIFYKNTPLDVPGFGDLKEKQAEFNRSLSQLKFSETKVSGIKQANFGKGSLLIGDDLDKVISFAGVSRETMIDNGIHPIRRKHNKGYYYFLVNQTDNKVDRWVPIETNAESIGLFNPMTGKTGYAIVKKENNTTFFYLQLEPGETCILETSSDNILGQIYPYTKAVGKVQEIVGEWTVKFINGGPKLPADIRTSKLQSWTEFNGEDVKNFSGTAKYSISFNKPLGNADGWVLDLGDIQESASVWLNGKELATLIGPVYKVIIPTDLLKDVNSLEINVSNSMANRISYMDKNRITWKKFYNINMSARLAENRGKDGKFTAVNWKPRPSGLIGKVSLTGIQYINPEVLP